MWDIGWIHQTRRLNKNVPHKLTSARPDCRAATAFPKLVLQEVCGELGHATLNKVTWTNLWPLSVITTGAEVCGTMQVRLMQSSKSNIAAFLFCFLNCIYHKPLCLIIKTTQSTLKLVIRRFQSLPPSLQRKECVFIYMFSLPNVAGDDS